MASNTPARLHILLARDSPIGLIIRRGPSKQTATILWDRTNDRFKIGQWLKGRIYERRCGLSPDGKHFIYFALTGKWTTEVEGAYTAISKAPFLQAIALYAKGDTWNGGGLWLSNQEFWLNDGLSPHKILKESPNLTRNLIWHPTGYGNSECLGVYFPRLFRDGWQGDLSAPRKSSAVAQLQKLGPDGWILSKHVHSSIKSKPGRGVYWDEHELSHSASGKVIPCTDWEWADWDGDRLVYTHEGRLESMNLTTNRTPEIKILKDFNDMKFTPIKAPYDQKKTQNSPA